MRLIRLQFSIAGLFLDSSCFWSNRVFQWMLTPQMKIIVVMKNIIAHSENSLLTVSQNMNSAETDKLFSLGISSSPEIWYLQKMFWKSQQLTWKLNIIWGDSSVHLKYRLNITSCYQRFLNNFFCFGCTFISGQVNLHVLTQVLSFL